MITSICFAVILLIQGYAIWFGERRALYVRRATQMTRSYDQLSRLLDVYQEMHLGMTSMHTSFKPNSLVMLFKAQIAMQIYMERRLGAMLESEEAIHQAHRFMLTSIETGRLPESDLIVWSRCLNRMADLKAQLASDTLAIIMESKRPVWWF